MVNGMRQVPIIRWSMRIGLAMSMSMCWSLSHAGAIRDGQPAIEPATADTTAAPLLPATDARAEPMPSAAMPVEHGLMLRTVPTVSAQISVGGTTLVPYIGAGFGGGYLTEFDRSLNPAQSPSSGSFNVGSKNLLGQQLIPNELQLGVRFPF